MMRRRGGGAAAAASVRRRSALCEVGGRSRRRLTGGGSPAPAARPLPARPSRPLTCNRFGARPGVVNRWRSRTGFEKVPLAMLNALTVDVEEYFHAHAYEKAIAPADWG